MTDAAKTVNTIKAVRFIPVTSNIQQASYVKLADRKTPDGVYTIHARNLCTPPSVIRVGT